MRPIDPDSASEPLLPADDAPDALDRLLAQARVPVREEFPGQVMRRVGAVPQSRRASAREWALAVGLAALLVLIAAAVLGGGDPRGGVVGSVVDLIVATLAAGAGFLAASWRGLGTAVDAALEGSVGALIALGLLALGANALLVLLLRRWREQRAGSRR